MLSGLEEVGGVLGGVDVSGSVELFGGELESPEGGVSEDPSPEELSSKSSELFEEESSELAKELSAFISLEFGGVALFVEQAKLGNKNPSVRHNARKERERFIMIPHE